MIWHYTVGKSFVSIVNDGYIKPATTYLPVGESLSSGSRLNSFGNLRSRRD